MKYVRQVGKPCRSPSEAEDTLAGCLSVEGVHYGYVDRESRCVIFIEVSEEDARNLGENQTRLLYGTLGKPVRDVQQGVEGAKPLPTRAVVQSVGKDCRAQNCTTLELMSEKSPWFMFGYSDPDNRDLVVMCVHPDHDIAGISRELA